MPIASSIETKKNNIIDLLIKGSKSIKRYSMIKQSLNGKQSPINK